MAKNSIRDYSATNSANTDIQSIDISEGCSPAGINNAIREVMADLKDVSTGAVALESPAADSLTVTGDLTVDTNTLYVDSTNNRVGIGTTSPSTWNTKLVVYNDQLTVTGGGYDGTFADSIYFGGNGEGTTYRNKISNSLSSTATNQMMKFSIANGASTWVDVMTLNGSGNVGIGTSSPIAQSKLTVAGNSLSITGADQNFGAGGVRGMLDLAGGYLRMGAVNGGGSANGIKLITPSGGEAVVVDSTGNVGIGTSSPASNTTHIAFRRSTFDRTQVVLGHSDTSSRTVVNFFANGTQGGSINTSPTATAYNTSSDYRLKENVTATWDATTRLKQLNPVRFNFIADADTTVDGFLAHEVQTVVPEAISGTKDAMVDEEYEVSAATGDIYTPAAEATYDEDGNEVTAAIDEVIHSADVEQPEELAEGQQWRETTAAVMGTRSVPNYQGIDQSKLVPLLVKTIQELEARITALEAN